MRLHRLASDRRGFTLVELVIVTAIIGILASAVLPLARWSVKRSKEHELQQNLRILRNAIDRYRDAAEAGVIEVPEGGTGFPESLDLLLQGVPMIAEMPVPVPAVGGEYDATGPGLTGGLATLAQQQAAAAGGAGGLAGGTGAQAIGGGNRPGLQQGGQGSAFGSAFGGASGSQFGQVASGTQFSSAGSSGLQLGGGTNRSGAGSQLGQQGGSSAMGGLSVSSAFSGQGSGFGAAGALGAGGAQERPQPVLGPDGKPLMLVLLRRLPVDPFTGKADWGLRCYGEPPEDRLWCGKDVFDIYSKSPAKAIDGTNYKDW